MLRFAADENFDNDIIRGLHRVDPAIDIVRVQDTNCQGVDDSAVLEWAAREGRLLLTHDASTLIRHAYDRVRNGAPMPGVVEVRCGSSIRLVVDDILLLARCSRESEWEGRVLFIPLL